jgi:hypothetical protein
LESISMRPSSRKRTSPSQWLRPYRMACAIDEPLATCTRVCSSQVFSAAARGLVFSCRTSRRSLVLAADLGFDLVEFGDPLQRLASNRRRRRFGEVEPLPAPMGPTERERSRPAGAVWIGESAIASICISSNLT